MDPTLSDASRRAIENDTEILTAGYSAGLDGEEWVCPSCFDEFAARFGWSSKTGQV
jgi:hypothetical protein